MNDEQLKKLREWYASPNPLGMTPAGVNAEVLAIIDEALSRGAQLAEARKGWVRVLDGEVCERCGRVKLQRAKDRQFYDADCLCLELDEARAALAKAERERDVAIADVKALAAFEADRLSNVTTERDALREELDRQDRALREIQATARALAFEEASRLVPEVWPEERSDAQGLAADIRALAPLPANLVAVSKEAMERVKAALGKSAEVIVNAATLHRPGDREVADECEATLSALESEASR